jgi:hypothetical protein
MHRYIGLIYNIIKIYSRSIATTFRHVRVHILLTSETPTLVQQKKQRSTKDTYKTKVLVTWIYLYLDVCSYYWLHTGPSLKSVGVSLSNDSSVCTRAFYIV